METISRVKFVGEFETENIFKNYRWITYDNNTISNTTTDTTQGTSDVDVSHENRSVTHANEEINEVDAAHESSSAVHATIVVLMRLNNSASPRKKHNAATQNYILLIS